ncbi:hypothetical protein FNV43_RR00648 [Rhamnella rubrinervis]|uniref:Uncharacterized protein n=1 Tax=Rhamnella rubrinervis TaxID=2594499 RepID=A0A8K0MSL5_9ROSA|nr:hypothetical protein FNV43_RR00648 [Rhamnella rubrinervis]
MASFKPICGLSYSTLLLDALNPSRATYSTFTHFGEVRTRLTPHPCSFENPSTCEAMSKMALILGWLLSLCCPCITGTFSTIPRMHTWWVEPYLILSKSSNSILSASSSKTPILVTFFVVRVQAKTMSSFTGAPKIMSGSTSSKDGWLEWLIYPLGGPASSIVALLLWLFTSLAPLKCAINSVDISVWRWSSSGPPGAYLTARWSSSTQHRFCLHFSGEDTPTGIVSGVLAVVTSNSFYGPSPEVISKAVECGPSSLPRDLPTMLASIHMAFNHVKIMPPSSLPGLTLHTRLLASCVRRQGLVLLSLGQVYLLTPHITCGIVCELFSMEWARGQPIRGSGILLYLGSFGPKGSFGFMEASSIWQAKGQPYIEYIFMAVGQLTISLSSVILKGNLLKEWGISKSGGMSATMTPLLKGSTMFISLIYVVGATFKAPPCHFAFLAPRVFLKSSSSSYGLRCKRSPKGRRAGLSSSASLSLASKVLPKVFSYMEKRSNNENGEKNGQKSFPISYLCLKYLLRGSWMSDIYRGTKGGDVAICALSGIRFEPTLMLLST